MYFIAAAGGLIKIGMSKDPQGRLRELQVGSAVALDLLAVMPGGRREEQRTHQRFWHLRERGEWFRPGSELLEFIRSLKEKCEGGVDDPQ